MLSANLLAWNLFADGISDKMQFQAICNNECDFDPSLGFDAKPTALNPRHLRRTTNLIRFVLHTAELTLNKTEYLHKVSSVFASSGGDHEIANSLCLALAEAAPAISPTQFHHSLLNVPSGYWHIANHNGNASTSICAREFTFAQALIEALVKIQDTQQPTLLLCYDMLPPEPLLACYPTIANFASGWLLAPESSMATLGKIQVTIGPKQTPDLPQHQSFRHLFQQNPAAQAIPLLEKCAMNEASQCIFAYDEHQTLQLHYQPHDH